MSSTADRIAHLREEQAAFTPGVLVRWSTDHHSHATTTAMVLSTEIAIVSFTGPALFLHTTEGEINAARVDIVPPVTFCDVPEDDRAAYEAAQDADADEDAEGEEDDWNDLGGPGWVARLNPAW